MVDIDNRNYLTYRSVEVDSPADGGQVSHVIDESEKNIHLSQLVEKGKQAISNREFVTIVF